MLPLKGGALALAGAAKPVRRSTANRVLKGFLKRVLEIGADESYLDVVDKVALFGSMLDPERDPVGDIDLTVRIVLHKERTAAAGKDVPFLLFQRDVGWGGVDLEEIPYKNETDVGRYLKSPKTSISLHGLSEDGVITGIPGVEHRTLYRRNHGLLATGLI